ncbi:hypothetical protein V1515DRAFT_578840 [Lipomyces mesembrius]
MSTAFYSIPLLDHFYRSATAFPIKDLADASKTIIFTMHNAIGRNVGVNNRMDRANVLLSRLCVYFFSMQMQRKGQRPVAEDKAEAEVAAPGREELIAIYVRTALKALFIIIALAVVR